MLKQEKGERGVVEVHNKELFFPPTLTRGAVTDRSPITGAEVPHTRKRQFTFVRHLTTSISSLYEPLASLSLLQDGPSCALPQEEAEPPLSLKI